MSPSNKISTSKKSDLKKTSPAVVNIEVDDEGLSQSEFNLLLKSYKEMLMVKAGLKKAIPASELWK